MPNYKEFKLYNGEVTVHFDEVNHAYWLVEDGKKRRIAGVTTFLNIIDKPALIPWAVGVTVEYIREHIADLSQSPAELLKLAKEEAARQRDVAKEIGSAIHAWIESYIKGEDFEMPDDEQVLKGVNSFIEWKDQQNVKLVESERLLYSKENEYMGTADLLLEIDGKKYLGDIKTGNAIYAETMLQTAAYAQAYQEETGETLAGRYVIRISKESEKEYVARMMKKTKGEGGFPDYKIFEAVEIKTDLASDFAAFMSAKNLYRWKGPAERSFDAMKNGS